MQYGCRFLTIDARCSPSYFSDQWFTLYFPAYRHFTNLLQWALFVISLPTGVSDKYFDRASPANMRRVDRICKRLIKKLISRACQTYAVDRLYSVRLCNVPVVNRSSAVSIQTIGNCTFDGRHGAI